MKRSWIIFCMCMVSVPNKIKSQFTENVGLYLCKIILDRGSTVTIYGLNVTNIGLPNMMAYCLETLATELLKVPLKFARMVPPA